jgi:3-oxoacyl-[acyl-carrier protein] reductase
MALEHMNYNRDKKTLAVIYGDGSLYRECATQLHQLIGNFSPLIVDQKYFNTDNIFFNGIPCAGPETLPALSRSTLIVICTRNHLVIADELRGMGFFNIKYALFELSSVRVKQILDYPKNTSTFGSYEVSFSHRTALITGSTRGIGLEIAVALASRGVRVILHGRTEASVKEGLRRFEKRTSSKTDGVVADLSDDDAPEFICRFLLEKNIKVDTLYNNAGISLSTSNLESDVYLNSFDECMIVNFRSVVGLTSRLLPKMLERGFGRIVFLTSMIRGEPDRIAYICSKAAATSYAYELAKQTQFTGVHVSLLDPGWVRSDMGGESATSDLNSVIPGALVGALALPIQNGIWVSAQDYSELTDAELVKKLIIDNFLI